ncbi:hypothetical protein JCM3765_003262 [Sporobolomyces pararoseus]
MSLSSSSSERFTTATSFLEHCSTDQILNYTVPTDSIIQETAPVPILNQPVDHALSSCTYFPPTTTSSSSCSTGGFILSRILEDGFTLELRWSKFFKDTSERDGDGDERFRELEQHPGTLAPVRFTFPSRLIPDPCFNIIYQQEEEEEEGEGEEVLQVLTVSEAGYLYSLNFPLDTLFYSLPEQGRQGDWSEEFKVEGLENKLPVLLKGVPQQSGRVVIACKDGTNLVVELAQDGGLIELELKSPSSSLFSFKSLVPSFSRRDLSSTSTSTPSSSSFPSSSTELVSSDSISDSNSSPSQLISLAISSSSSTNESSGSSSFGFGVSRDKKLKIWNLDSGNCLRSIDLPKPTSSSTSQQQQIISSTSTSDSPAQPQQQKSSQLLLPSTPQTFLKITPSSSSSSSSSSDEDEDEESIYESYLTIYSPGSLGSSGGGGSLFIYGLVTDSTNSSQSTSNGSGGISQLTPIAERTLPSGEISGGVIDFEISKIRLGRQGGQEGKGKWNLWVLDQISGVGEARIRVCGLSELDDIDGYDDYMDDDWKEVSTGGGGGGGKNSTVEWNSSYFDQQIQSCFPQLSISEIFLKHISIPGRYPGSSFDYALTIYEEMILNNNTNDQNEELVRLTLEQEYESDLIRTAAVVGCQFELEYSQQTGAALKEDYNKKLKLEWLKFVSLLNESRKEALYPIKLELDQLRGLVFVIGRDSLSVPVKEELVISLHRQLLSSTSPSNSLQELVPLFPQYPQSNFVQLLSLIKSVVSKLSLEELNKFESILFDRLRKPFTTDLEDVALSIFEESLLSLEEEEEGFLDQVLQGLKSFIEPSKTIESFCQLLISTSTSDTTSSSSSSSSTRTSTSTTTDLSNSLLSDLINSSIQARYDLSKSLVLLLIVAWGATAAANDINNDVQEPPIADFEQISSIAFTTLNSISNLEWIKNQIVNPTYEAVQHLKSSTIEHDDDEFEDKFERLRMREEEGGGGAEVLPVPIYSLLNSLLRLPIYSPPCISCTFLPDSLYSASSSFMSLLGLLPTTPKLLIESTDSKQIEFLSILQKLGLNQQVLELLSSSAVNDGQGGGGGGLFPQSIGTCYVKGRAELELGNEELARKWFEKCACGFYFPDTDQDQGGLESILLSTTRHGRGGRDKINSLSKFYIHLVSLFVPTSFDYSIARFSQLALDALDEEGVEEQDEVVEKDLWMKLFTSFAKMGQFEKAYQVIMETPHHETKTTCLAHFISLVCENGASSLLTSLSFVGLENDLERNLSFRARNSDPLIQIHHQTSTSTSSSPDYYKILYSYHVSKGDFKSAATVMYQQARRIGELSNTRTSQISFRDLVTAQCQSYLAATNALSLVEKEQAWVAIVLGGRDDGELRVQNKRRKIHYYIPEDEYDPTSSRPLELKELVDIRKEYQIALARLQLSNEFPELERTNFHLEPEAVVSLFTQTNCFDQAFQIATSLKVDLSSVFETLAEKCVSLTIHHPQDVGIVEQDSSWVTSSIETSTWSGSLSSKAWKLLNLYLKRHDLSPNYFYHSVVLERVLATTNINHDGDGDGGKKLPEFLMDFWIEKEQPQTLLRSLIKFDKLDQAFKYSLQTVKNSKISNSNFSTNLPYSIFDQLLEIPTSDSRNLSDDVLKQLQQELRNALEERKNKLENIGNSLRR